MESIFLLNLQSLYQVELLSFARYMEILHNISHPFQKEILNLISLEIDEIPEEVFRYQYPLQEEVLFIGFAETATSLGHSMFQCFQNAKYVHTTRNRYPT